MTCRSLVRPRGLQLGQRQALARHDPRHLRLVQALPQSQRPRRLSWRGNRRRRREVHAPRPRHRSGPLRSVLLRLLLPPIPLQPDHHAAPVCASRVTPLRERAVRQPEAPHGRRVRAPTVRKLAPGHAAGTARAPWHPEELLPVHRVRAYRPYRVRHEPGHEQRTDDPIVDCRHGPVRRPPGVDQPDQRRHARDHAQHVPPDHRRGQ